MKPIIFYFFCFCTGFWPSIVDEWSDWCVEACTLIKRCSPWELSNLVFPGYILERSSLPLDPKQIGFLSHSLFNAQIRC